MDLDPVCEIGCIERREYSPLAHTLYRRSVLEGRSRRCCLDDDPLLPREIVCPFESVQCAIERIEILDSSACEFDIYPIRESAPCEELVHILVCTGT
jgi:hypothetical protein